MIPRELAQQIRRLEIMTRKAVEDSLAGEYSSSFKGQGIEFEEVREYQPGDDVRSIDWNVTARMGHPFIKRFVEERELTVMLLVDFSASGAFGSASRLKNDVATELCALLAFSAIRNQDKVGLILFTDCIERILPPLKGPSHVYRMIRDLLRFQPSQTGTNLASGIECLDRVVTRRCVAFLISDFQDTGYERPLRVVGRRHDLIAISISDPREAQMPDVGLIELEDLETAALMELDTSSASVRRDYHQANVARRFRLREIFHAAGIDQVEIGSDGDPGRALFKFFRTRALRAGR